MNKYITIIMVVIGLLLTMLFALPRTAKAQVEITTRLTTAAEAVFMENTVREVSDSQNDSSTGALIESEVSFYGQTHGLGPCSLLTRCSDPAVAKARAQSENILDLQAEVLQAVYGRSHLTARAGVSKKFTNTPTLIPVPIP